MLLNSEFYIRLFVISIPFWDGLIQVVFNPGTNKALIIMLISQITHPNE